MPSIQYASRRRGRNRGFTFVEITVALVLVTLAFSAFMGVALESVRDFELYNAQSQISQWNQQVVNSIRNDTLSSKGYFEDDAASLAYFNALDLPADAPPLSSLRLPLIDEEGGIETDTAGNEKTGNALFFVKVVAIKATDDPFVRPESDYVTDFTVAIGEDPEDTATYRISTYRFVLYYLMRRNQESIGTCPFSLDLIRWVSVPFLDYGQVMAVDESVVDDDSGVTFYPRDDLAAQFVAKYGSNYLWDSAKDVNEAFYYCDDLGRIDDIPDAAMIIPQDPGMGFRSVIPGSPTGRRTSICMNDGTPNFQAGPIVPAFGLRDNTGDGFPHGFEVQLVGPSGARELLIRVAMAKEGANRIIGRDFRAVLTTRDF